MTLLTFEPGTTQINSESFVTVLRQHVWFCILIGQGRPTYGTREHFLGTRHSLLFQIFLFLLYYQLPYIVKKMYVRACVYIYIYIKYALIPPICLHITGYLQAKLVALHLGLLSLSTMTGLACIYIFGGACPNFLYFSKKFFRFSWGFWAGK